MKYFLAILIGIASYQFAIAQDSTILYLDYKGTAVSESDSYQFVRVEKRTSSLIEVDIYDRSDVLVMKGTRSPLFDTDHWEQELTYYAEVGNRTQSFFYIDNKKEGKGFTYYNDGNIQSITDYKNDLKNGVDSIFYKDGSISAKSNYVNDLREEKAYAYYKNGKISAEENYDHGIKSGVQIYYFEDGNIRRKEVYVAEERTEASCFDLSGKEIEFFERNTPAYFNGNINKYLSNNIIYPDDAIELGISGKVILEFIVVKDGGIGKIEVIQTAHRSLTKEALRVLEKSSGLWIPGKLEDEYIDTKFNVPVIFNLAQ